MSKQGINISDICVWNNHSITFLYDHFYSSLVVYAMQTVEKAVAEDIVQELFSTLWEKRLDFASVAALKSYLYNSVHNAVRNCIRHEVVHNNFAQSYLNDNAGFLLTDDGQEQFFSEEVFRLLFLAIDSLPRRQREVLLLCMEGKKNREIAKQLDVSFETVKSLKRRAITTLREKLSSNAFVLLFCLLGL